MSKKLERLKAKFQAQYGDDTVMFLSEVPVSGTISSGSLSLDYATGIGGFPDNRAIEIAGANGSGKSTLAFSTIDNALKAYPDRGALYLDLEGRVAEDWLRKHVEDYERVIVAQPDTAEQATDIYRDFVSSGDISVAVFDSIGGAPSQRYFDKSAQGGNFGGNSLAITRFSQFAQNLSNKYRCLTIGVNQVRADMAGYNRLITPGGEGWKHATSLRIELKRKTRDVLWVKDSDGQDVVCGFKVSAKIHKNSVGRSGTAIEFWLYSLDTEEYGPVGIDQNQELINLSILAGILDKGGGGVYRYEHLPNGKIRGYDKLVKLLLEDKEVFGKMKSEVVRRLEQGSLVGFADNFEARDESFDVKE